jgi:CelD/BcsL family acetyltransferase involved in cellulose biosynthesis
MPPDTWEIVDDPAALRALEPEWDALWDRVHDAYATQRFAWCWASWNHVAQPLGRKLRCVVGRSGGELVAVWPFVTYRYGLWTRARPLSPEVAEYTSILLERDERTGARVAAAWETLSRGVRCDAILLPYVPAGTTLHRFMEQQRRPMLTQSTPLSSTRIETEDDRAAFAKVLQSKSLAKHRRRLQKLGELRAERVTDPDRRAAIVKWTLQQKEAWLARTGGHPLWHSTELYRNFLVAAAPDERFEVFALTLDGAPVASCIARVDNFRFEQFLSAYDFKYQDFSPGQLLRVEDMSWVFERDLEYDLRVGEHAYKKDWTNRSSFAVSYNVANSLWGRVAVAAREAQLGLRKPSAA